MRSGDRSPGVKIPGNRNPVDESPGEIASRESRRGVLEIVPERDGFQISCIPGPSGETTDNPRLWIFEAFELNTGFFMKPVDLFSPKENEE